MPTSKCILANKQKHHLQFQKPKSSKLNLRSLFVPSLSAKCLCVGVKPWQNVRKKFPGTVPFSGSKLIWIIGSTLGRILLLSFVEISSVVFVQSCWRTNQPKDTDTNTDQCHPLSFQFLADLSCLPLQVPSWVYNRIEWRNNNDCSASLSRFSIRNVKTSSTQQLPPPTFTLFLTSTRPQCSNLLHIIKLIVIKLITHTTHSKRGIIVFLSAPPRCYSSQRSHTFSSPYGIWHRCLQDAKQRPFQMLRATASHVWDVHAPASQNNNDLLL